MRIDGIRGSTVGSLSRRPAARPDQAERCEPETKTRALIAIEAAAASERPVAARRLPSAPFLAQLIATRMHAPQTRARWRAEPEDAAMAYRRAGRPEDEHHDKERVS